MVTASWSWNPVIIGDGQLTDGDVEVMSGGQLRYSAEIITKINTEYGQHQWT